MDCEKASQEDNSFLIQPKWAPQYGSQHSSQNRKHFLKPVLTILVLGLLALCTFQAIRCTSSPNFGDHSTNGMELHGDINLDFGDMVPSVAVDESWLFNAFSTKQCSGDTAAKSGKGFQACQQINNNKTYATVSVPTLPDSLRLCLYPEGLCSENATAITTPIGCTPANASYYAVKGSQEAC
ncbi:hypothetical protein HD806DRAFT_553240 [Xylariaceae sp. AK1471]|nr:hypothetical protein HD806DRAFT_553240 [Xylariaceae sp. AK1471]